MQQMAVNLNFHFIGYVVVERVHFYLSVEYERCNLSHNIREENKHIWLIA